MSDTWVVQLKAAPLEWLLEPDDPGARYLTLRDLLDAPHCDEALIDARHRAHTAGPIAAILDRMDATGYWAKPGTGYSPKYRSTVWSLILLAQLGARADLDERIERACGYLLDHALNPAGQFSAIASGAPSGTIDCLQGNLCAALLDLGYDDPRLDCAFEWMARSVTGEGVAPPEVRDAEMRYYAYNCGPLFACGANGSLPCAWGAAKVMLAFGKLPRARRTPFIYSAIQQGVEFLFSVDPAAANYPTRDGRKPNTSWWKFGFPVFYVTDILQIVEALALLGYGHDPRLANALAVVHDKQDGQGRWALEYDYAGKTWLDFGPMRQPNKWVTLRALKALKLADERGVEARYGTFYFIS